MTQKEFLKAIALNREDFQDLLQKFSAFNSSLNPAQQDAIKRSTPKISQALRSLGKNVTAEQLAEIVKELSPLGGDDGDAGTFVSKFLVKKSNPLKPKPKPKLKD